MALAKRAHPAKLGLDERSTSWDEVNLGLSEEQAVAEAVRCLNCRPAPCVRGCPVEVPTVEFIQLVKARRFGEALELIKSCNSLPAICGRVCPQEVQCETHCVLARRGEPIAIGLLERFVADRAADAEAQVAAAPPQVATDGLSAAAAEELAATSACEPLHRVAVVGSGPGGLTCSADLAQMGYGVTLFESLHATGGVLRYGIPEFRLPKNIVDREVEAIKSCGVELQLNVVVGQTVTLDELRDEGYEAVFIAAGAGLPYFLGIPGENLGGVYTANEFLTRVNLMKAYKFPEYDTPVRIGQRVGVVGGGNVAMDAARTALRLGSSQVTIFYRRSRDEMPARLEEIENAAEEGIAFECLANPVRIIADSVGHVEAMECIRMELGEPDASGRPRPQPVPGSEYVTPLDTVIIAVGQGPNPLLTRNSPNLELGKRGHIIADPVTGATSIEGVYAGGDVVTGSATVIAAMGAGKVAARSIDAYIKSRQ